MNSLSKNIFSRPLSPLALFRFFLGISFLLSFLFLLSHSPKIPVQPKFGWIELTFLPRLELDSTPLLILLSLALPLSVLFSLGYFVTILGFALLLLHIFFNLGTLSYSWEPSADIFLLTFLGFTWFQRRKKELSSVIFKFIQIEVSIAFALVAWSQLTNTPWLTRSVTQLYFDHSPLGLLVFPRLDAAFLTEIFGSFAWLLSLFAPVLLWQKQFGKYCAMILILTFLALCPLTPLVYWNILPVALCSLFLPNVWFDSNPIVRTNLITQWQEAARAICLSLTVLMMVSITFDRNYNDQFGFWAKINRPKLTKAYRILTNPFVKTGDVILFNPIWKMYSPVWKTVNWIDWFAKDSKGNITAIPQENFSPDYRLHRRTWTEALWTDYKKEKVFISMLSSREERISYTKYLCYELGKIGQKPSSIFLEIKKFRIRGPDEHWDLRTQKPDEVKREEEVICD